MPQNCVFTLEGFDEFYSGGSAMRLLIRIRACSELALHYSGLRWSLDKQVFKL